MQDDKEDSFISHLEALRSMLIKSLSALAICLLPVFFITPYVMEILINVMVKNTDMSLNFFSPMEVFFIQIKIAVMLDILVCFPYVAKQVWIFILPALYEKERRFLKSIIWVSSSLFIIGVFFCLFLILPLVIKFGMSFASDHIQPVWGIGHIISLALWLSLIFGLMFQFPLITYALVRYDIISYETMQSKRRYVLIGILIISGVLTPPDIISQLMLTLPTYALFEAGMFFAKKQKNH